MSTSTEPALTRRLSLFDAVCTMIGIILGSGIFVAPASLAAVAPHPYGAAALWLLGGGIALCGALCYAECASRLPCDGGFFVYYERAFGKQVAQIAGWAGWLVTYPVSLTAMAWIAARYLKGMLHVEGFAQTSLAACLLVGCAGLVAVGVRFGAWLQRLLTAAKVAAIVLVAGAAIWHGGGAVDTAWPKDELVPLTPAVYLTAFATMMWTFDGWSDITMLAGEIKRPQRDLILTAIFGVMVPAVCYALLQLAVMTLLPATVAMRSPYVLLEALQVIGGPAAATLLGCLALICAVGALHGVSSAVSRLGWSMATAGQVPSFFAALHPRLQTPIRALLVPVVLALFYLVSNNFNDLMGYFAFSIWLYYALTAVALLRLRAAKIGEAGVWRAPGGVLAPAVVLLTTAVMTSLQLWEHPWQTLVGVCTVTACALVNGLLRGSWRGRTDSLAQRGG